MHHSDDAHGPKRPTAVELFAGVGGFQLALDAAGFDVVLVETVGVGQDEVEIAHTADATVVVLVPGTGDEVQAMKAGIMEIADVFVANKADRDGIDRLVQSVEAALSLEPVPPGGWTPPVLKTEATTGRGVAELWAALGRFRARPEGERAERRRVRAHARVTQVVGELLMARVYEAVPAALYAQAVDDVASRRMDPYTAAHTLVRAATAAPPGAA